MQEEQGQLERKAPKRGLSTGESEEEALPVGWGGGALGEGQGQVTDKEKVEVALGMKRRAV